MKDLGLVKSCRSLPVVVCLSKQLLHLFLQLLFVFLIYCCVFFTITITVYLEFLAAGVAMIWNYCDQWSHAYGMMNLLDKALIFCSSFLLPLLSYFCTNCAVIFKKKRHLNKLYIPVFRLLILIIVIIQSTSTILCTVWKYTVQWLITALWVICNWLPNIPPEPMTNTCRIH